MPGWREHLDSNQRSQSWLCIIWHHPEHSVCLDALVNSNILNVYIFCVCMRSKLPFRCIILKKQKTILIVDLGFVLCRRCHHFNFKNRYVSIRFGFRVWVISHVCDMCLTLSLSILFIGYNIGYWLAVSTHDFIVHVLCAFWSCLQSTILQ